MKKSKTYTPQVRKPRRTAETPAPAEIASSPDPVGYERLTKVLNLSPALFENAREASPHTIADLVAARYLFTTLEDPTPEDFKSTQLMTANSLILADEWMQAHGLDLASDPSAAKSLNKFEQEQVFLDHMNIAEEIFDPETHEPNMDMFMTSAASSPILITAFARSGKMPQIVQHYTSGTYNTLMNDSPLAAGLMTPEQIDQHAVYISEKMRDYFRIVGDNPQRARQDISRVFGELRNPELRAFIEQEIETYNTDWLAWSEEDEASATLETNFGGQEVDFSILPPGTDIREYTERLYESLGSQDREMVDLKRVGVLETLRSALGTERCYYVHGRQIGNAVTDENGVAIRPDYIGLVIQNHDTDGRVTGEDAVAISPIAKKHAGYLFRQAYSAHTSWRATLSLPKADARANGARPLKFTSVADQDMYEAYTKKAIQLLTCPPEQFGKEYELRCNNGEYTLHKRTNRTLGERALQASMLY